MELSDLTITLFGTLSISNWKDKLWLSWPRLGISLKLQCTVLGLFSITQHSTGWKHRLIISWILVECTHESWQIVRLTSPCNIFLCTLWVASHLHIAVIWILMVMRRMLFFSCGFILFFLLFLVSFLYLLCAIFYFHNQLNKRYQLLNR